MSVRIADKIIASTGGEVSISTNYNIGDIFYTSRLDSELNGAFDCDGREFSFDYFSGDQNPYDLLLNNRIQSISYTDYENQISTYGVCGAFAIDTVNKKFKVPTLKTVFIEAGSVNDIGSFTVAGLPNITTDGVSDIYSIYYKEGTYSKGPFSLTAGSSGTNSSGGNYVHKTTFDASLSNPIYGASDTVQPNSIKYRPMVQLATSVNENSVDNYVNLVKEAGEAQKEEVAIKGQEYVNLAKQYAEASHGMNIGNVYYSQSSKNTDNPGSLPLFTGETIANFNNIYPDFYAWLQEHPELTCAQEEYNNTLATYGECPKYSIFTQEIYGDGVNIATRANAISSGEANFQSGYLDFPFDGEAAGPNGTNYWSARGQGDYGDTFVGCYLGNINLTEKVVTVKLAQGIWSSSGVSSVKVQYSPDNGTTWQDLQTYDTPLQANWGDYNVLALPDYTPTTTYGLRVMVVSEPGNIRSWYVYELQFLTEGKKVGESTSLRLPLLKNYIKMANVEEGIQSIEAGLPNITGAFPSGTEKPTGDYFEGAFANTGDNNNSAFAGGTNFFKQASFDASRSSAVYGGSATVTPAHTTLYPWVFAFNSETKTSTAQASQFQEALSSKVSKSGDAITGELSFNNLYKAVSFDTQFNLYDNQNRGLLMGSWANSRPQYYDGSNAYDIVILADSYSDENGNWYRLYSDGWLEQGAFLNGTYNKTSTINLLKPFANTNYTIVTTAKQINTSDSVACSPVNKTTTSFMIEAFRGGTPNVSADWLSYYACGKADTDNMGGG
ncbi:MAG: hypothetical protein NC222_06085 [Staphylococcus sp.]|nr:hypothetical protein [Staphylococcus sp.]